MLNKDYPADYHLLSPRLSIQYRNQSIVHNANDYKKGFFIYKEPYHLHNIGHVLGDDIWAYFSLLYDLNLQFVSRKDVWIIISKSLEDTINKKSIIQQHYQLISANPIIYYDNNLDNKHKNVIYQNLIVGWAGYGYVVTNKYGKSLQPEKIAAFRLRVVSSFGLSDKINSSSTCNVLFIEKALGVAEHKYSISNVDELIQTLRENSSCKIEKASWHGMTLKDQITKIYDKNIVIGLPGSDIMNCIFQPSS